ncbi:RluA family pseudouridine synthase [Puteibacter caeruleilacunae]|nr:RluA family pseudouridine synthase [Puteibacter caeruleilacunae]
MSDLHVLYEDNHIIAINKSSSDIVQGDKTGDKPLSEKVKDYLKKKYNKPGNVFVGVTHRLDRPTSGIVLFARTSKALTRLNKMFQQKGDIHKTYWAVVDSIPGAKEATLEHHLVRRPEKNKSFAYDKPKQGSKHASLSYKHLVSSKKYHLLEIELHTGRHHQIRCQLAKCGSHIKGDLKYGFPRSNPNAGIHLHARAIKFIHPVKQEPITITAPVPNDNLWKEMEKLASK